MITLRRFCARRRARWTRGESVGPWDDGVMARTIVDHMARAV